MKKISKIIVSISCIIILLFSVKSIIFYNSSLNYYLMGSLDNITNKCEYIDLNFPSDKNIERKKLEPLFMAFQDVIKNYSDLSEIAVRANSEISLTYLSSLQLKFNLILNDKDNNYLSEEEVNTLTEIHDFCINSKLKIDEYTKRYDNIVSKNRWVDILEETMR